MHAQPALLVLCLLAAAPLRADETPSPTTAPVLFEGMGAHHRGIATKDATAQRWFDQALTWTFAFNHDEAIRSYEQVLKLEPRTPLAWWGISLSNGPHINNPMMDDAHSQAAWDALQQAIALRDRATPVERDLIDALTHRYSKPWPANRAALDQAYADAMRAVWRRHPSDADVGVLCAEAIMDLHPWDLFTTTGQPKQDTEEILAILESVLARWPEHPGANHLYIHAIEASSRPEKGLPSAKRLATLVPASGHLVHMPSHIHARVGDWSAAVASNEQAIVVDTAYRKLSPRQGLYNVYMAHDTQFLSFACMMSGREKRAREAARATVNGFPEDFLREAAPFVDPVMGLELEVMLRFGRYEELLAAPEPEARFPISRAMRHANRANAFAALGRIDEALKSQAEFTALAAAIPPDAPYINNTAGQILAIAARKVSGEIAWAKGDADTAIAELKAGVALEDRLKYDEPPDWILPLRHPLGAILLAKGRAIEAERFYREDLRKWPDNGWSLLGLSRALEAQGRGSEAKAVDKRLRRTWKDADFPLVSSCACVKPGTGAQRLAKGTAGS